MKKTILIASFAAIAAITSAIAEDKKEHGHAPNAGTVAPPPAETPSPEGARAYFISPKDGATIKGGEVIVRFGLSGMGVAPAGIYMENTGHHHLLVNMDVSELPAMNIPLPAIDGKCLHYGAGQTETKLTLEPGEYTLQMVLGNYSHVPHTPPVVSKKITITVEK